MDFEFYECNNSLGSSHLCAQRIYLQDGNQHFRLCNYRNGTCPDKSTHIILLNLSKKVEVDQEIRKQNDDMTTLLGRVYNEAELSTELAEEIENVLKTFGEPYPTEDIPNEPPKKA